MVTKCLSGKYLWKSGRQAGFLCEESGALLLAANATQGIFVSRTYDSGAADMEWGRLKLDIDEKIAFSVSVLFFSKPQTEKRLQDMESAEEQHAFVTAHAAITSSYRDVLLYKNGIKSGRYMRFCIRVLRGDENVRIRLRGYEVTFPKENFADYLPAIYRNNPQLERYMAVLQEPYMALEQQIEDIPRQLDYEHAGKEQLVRLAEWLGYDKEVERLDKKLLIKLLGGGVELARQKGTAYYYKTLVRLLTGLEAAVIENCESRECTLLIRGEADDIQESYLKWVTDNAPLGVAMKSVILRPDDRLDDTCFLDYTAMLTKKECALSEEGIDADNIMLI